MVKAKQYRSFFSVLLLAAAVLIAAAILRSAEYDEQYTLFLTAGTPRPDWPATEFAAGAVTHLQAGKATLAEIARDLRATDVHPPLYFWAVSLCRQALGSGLLTARMLSVLFGVTSIALVGVIARRSAVPPMTAMLLTLGCYGFVHTSVVARGFAAADMLTLSGVALLLGRRRVSAGICLGAACCCNYLAVFVAAAVILVDGAWIAVPAAIPFLALDLWFFVAQHAARNGQFPPFALWPSLMRLAEYQVAAMFGGLPLYVGDAWQLPVEALLAIVATALLMAIARSRPWRRHRLIVAASIAPPIGLLLLGAVFNNTPIELRYLSFGLPFAALLVAASMKHPVAVAPLQIAGIIGLLLSPRTMQPARTAVTEAARLAGDATILLPAGNDGVGIVGAFASEAPATVRILLIHPTDPIAERIAAYRRVALALLPQDQDSKAAIAAAHDVLSLPNWRRIAIGSRLEVFERGD